MFTSFNSYIVVGGAGMAHVYQNDGLLCLLYYAALQKIDVL